MTKKFKYFPKNHKLEISSIKNGITETMIKKAMYLFFFLFIFYLK